MNPAGERIEIRWYALRVRARAEQSVTFLLTLKRFECFVPGCREQRKYSDRMVHAQVSVFPGYVFCRFDLALRLEVLNTFGVQQIVGLGLRPESIDDEVIHALQLAFHRAEFVRPIEYVLKGEPIRVVRGPMAGTAGTFLRSKSGNRLVISVDLLQRAVALEIDSEAVITLRKSA